MDHSCETLGDGVAGRVMMEGLVSLRNEIFEFVNVGIQERYQHTVLIFQDLMTSQKLYTHWILDIMT